MVKPSTVNPTTATTKVSMDSAFLLLPAGSGPRDRPFGTTLVTYYLSRITVGQRGLPHPRVRGASDADILPREIDISGLIDLGRREPREGLEVSFKRAVSEIAETNIVTGAARVAAARLRPTSTGTSTRSTTLTAVRLPTAAIDGWLTLSRLLRTCCRQHPTIIR
jgi:hypothetical protein